MKKNKKLNEQAETLNRRMLNAKAEIFRLADLADLLDADPENDDLRREYDSRRERIEILLSALRELPENELELLYMHYEAELSFRQMESCGRLHYSYKSIQLKNRIILERMILEFGPCLL